MQICMQFFSSYTPRNLPVSYLLPISILCLSSVYLLFILCLSSVYRSFILRISFGSTMVDYADEKGHIS